MTKAYRAFTCLAQTIPWSFVRLMAHSVRFQSQTHQRKIYDLTMNKREAECETVSRSGRTKARKASNGERNRRSPYAPATYRFRYSNRNSSNQLYGQLFKEHNTNNNASGVLSEQRIGGMVAFRRVVKPHFAKHAFWLHTTKHNETR